MEPQSDTSCLPFFLGREQHQSGQWQCLSRLSPDAINSHRVIFSITYALKCLHERDRIYGELCIDDVFVYHPSQDHSQVYKLVERETVQKKQKDEDWRSFAKFMLKVLYVSDHNIWPSNSDEEALFMPNRSVFRNPIRYDIASFLDLARLLLTEESFDPEFLNAIPEYFLHWYKREADFNQGYTVSHCLCCHNRERGTLVESRHLADCTDNCFGYYCNHCLNSYKMAQFCPHHGPGSKGLKFCCSKCKAYFGTFREWENHVGCTASPSTKAATLKIGTWNVTSLSKESDLVWILLEMNALKLDILGISETKWKDPGLEFLYELNGKKYYIISSTEREKFTKEPKGVAWILDERLYDYVRITRYKNNESNRILTIALPENANINLVFTQIYAPTYKKEDEQKSFYYDAMYQFTGSSVIAGDFNEAIKYSDYCCLSQRKLLSEFCSKNRFVISNMWPSDEKPVTRACNDFILMTNELWETKCVSSSKNFFAVYKSDHQFPVVANLKFDEVKLKPHSDQQTSATKPPAPFNRMSKDKKQKFQKWYDMKKSEITKQMAEVKECVRGLLVQGIKVKPKDDTFIYHAADISAMADSVSGLLLEKSYTTCQKQVLQADEDQLNSVFNGEIDNQSKKILVELVKRYKKLISDAIEEGRTEKWIESVRKSHQALEN